MRQVTILGFLILLAGVAACASRTPSAGPPAGSPELTRFIEIRCPGYEATCGEVVPGILSELEVIHHRSRPSQDLWVPYAETDPFTRSDAERLWNTGTLESLWVEVADDPYPSGIGGKRIVFNVVRREGEPTVPTELPTLPMGFEEPPPGHERVFP